MKAKSKVYKIATYGGKSSGKTCILAALTLTRPSNPCGFTCTWVADKPKSAVAGQSLPPDDPYLAGWHWIHEQRQRLSAGELPMANPVTSILKYLFGITSPAEGMKTIEIIDYSGELVLSGEQLKENLKRHMRECDGIMILAEVPRKGVDGTALAIELEDLKQAFSALLAEKTEDAKQDWPIALLLNKWDRIAPKPPADAGEADNAVQGFLNQSPRPPHGQMVDTLANVVSDGFMKSFAVSAFGAHEFGPSGREIPRLNHGIIESYGLEDPLVWLVKRTDASEAQGIAKAVRENSKAWHPLQWITGASVKQANAGEGSFWGLSTHKALKSANSFLQRISEKNQHVQMVRDARSLLWRNRICQFASFLVTMFVLSNLFNICIDYAKTKDVKYVLSGQDSSASEEKIKESEDWALNYAHASTSLRLFSRWILLGTNQAEELVRNSCEKRSEACWAEVQKASNEGDIVKLAEKYLVKFPAGIYQEQAKAIIESGAGREKDSENDAHLAKIENESSKADTRLNYEKIDELEKQANKIPHVDRLKTKNGMVIYERIQINLEARRKEEFDRINKKKWDEFIVEVEKMQKSRSFLELANALVSRRADKNFPTEEALSKLENNFRGSADQGIREQVADAINRRQWDEARNHAKLFNDQNIQNLLKKSDNDVNDLVASILKKVDEAEDQDIYLDIKKYGIDSRRSCEKYLNLPFKQKYCKEVNAYLEYINALDNELEINLEFSKLMVDKDFYNYWGNLNGALIVRINDKDAINVKPMYLQRGKEFADLGEGKFKAKFKQRMNLKVEIRIQQGYFWNGNSSVLYTDSAYKDVTVEELNQGLDLQIPGSVRPWSNTARFQITGVPVEPKLP